MEAPQNPSGGATKVPRLWHVSVILSHSCSSAALPSWAGHQWLFPAMAESWGLSPLCLVCCAEDNLTPQGLAMKCCFNHNLQSTDDEESGFPTAAECLRRGDTQCQGSVASTSWGWRNCHS